MSSFSPHNFGVLIVRTDRPMASGDEMTCTVYADGRPVRAITTSNRPERLPSGFLAEEWEIEITGTVGVSSVSMAHTMQELEGAA